MSVTHSTFTLERTYPAATDRVWKRWSDAQAKAEWFAPTDENHTLDFRVGGIETASGTNDGTRIDWQSLYRDIVPGERIVYSSTLTWGDRLATVSMTTVELFATGGGTRLVLTEQGTYLDGLELPEWRRDGTDQQLAALGKTLIA